MAMEVSTSTPPNDTPAGYLSLVDNRSQNQSQQLLPLWDREIFKIGRDPKTNTLAIDNDPSFNVSRNHCEIYVVVYEPTVNFIYVRDRKSSNGTYVNGELIGSRPEVSPGYLLQDGDVIEIQPHWTFVLTQERSPPRQQLDKLQLAECQTFADKYLVTSRCLGQGAEAAVHLAVDAVTKKQLVCKVVNLDRLKGKNMREEVRRKHQEGDILRQLRHPNILPYVDMISSPHTLYTFTDLASGGDLMSFMYRHETVKELDARIIIRQVVRGLEYLHGKGIVHRDVKPENILLAYSPKLAYHRIMLADFGNSAVPRRSRMMTVVGTLNYQAPEVFGDSQAYTSAVDIWSLGVVTLILLLSGLEVDIKDLNRMSQTDIQGYLSAMCEKMVKQPSNDGKKFLLDCLQTNPFSRMTARQAAKHDWLSRPAKNKQFFLFLDKKMMSEWDPRNELKPMPLELPSLRTSPIPEPELRSQYFATEATPPPSTSPEKGSSTWKLPESSEAGDDQVDADMSPPQATTGGGELGHKGKNDKRGGSQSDGFLKPLLPEQAAHRANRRRKTRFRGREPNLYPLPGLDRHLAPACSNRLHRQQVLDELERSQVKFLADSKGVGE